MPRRNRLLSDPFVQVPIGISNNIEPCDDLINSFDNLRVSEENSTNMQEFMNEINQRFAQMSTEHASAQAQLVAANNELRERMTTEHNASVLQLTEQITELRAAQVAQQRPAVNVVEYTDIVPNYATGNDIQLDAFKVIHEFSGDKKVYRSWRTQVSKLMKQIERHQTHPKYAAALSIIRAKITGPASDILINNNTALHIDAIIDRLDFSYSDQRPLYVIENEMTSIRQGSKTLQEFYDAINQALNMVLTKIAMTYKEAAEQRSLVNETQSKAIRTFITGLNSTLIRTTLYGNMPDTLSKAFAVAQTIQFDNQHLQLEHKVTEHQKNAKKFIDPRPISNPDFRYQSQPPNQPPKMNFNSAQPNKPQQHKPMPMEIDSSGQYVQKTQFQSNDFQHFKRQREPSFQYANNQQPSYQNVNKQQRVNHVNDDIKSVHGNSMDNNCDAEPNDDASTVSDEESTFLEE